MGIAETSSQTLGLKSCTTMQVLAVVVLVVDCLTKACSFCSCSSNDLQNRKHRFMQWLNQELHSPHAPFQPGTDHNPKKRNNLPHHISCHVQQRELACSASATAAPSSATRGSELCRLTPFPGKMNSTGEKEILLVNSSNFTSLSLRESATTSGWLGELLELLVSTWHQLEQSPENDISHQVWGGVNPAQSCREAPD